MLIAHLHKQKKKSTVLSESDDLLKSPHIKKNFEIVRSLTVSVGVGLSSGFRLDHDFI